MYGLVLMAAMGGTPDTAAFHPRTAGCSGCCGGVVVASCHGCCGGFLGHKSSCYGCCGGVGAYSSCHGCCGGFMAHKHYSYGCCGGASCFGSCWGSCTGYGPQAYIYPSYAVPVPTGAGAYFYAGPGVHIVPIVIPEAGKDEGKDKPKPKPNSTEGEKGTKPTGANLKFNLPAGAVLFVDGAKTAGDGEERSFFTPPLEPGQKYFYDVRAEIAVDGKVVVEEKRVIVESGAEIRESFPKMTAAVAAARTVAGK